MATVTLKAAGFAGGAVGFGSGSKMLGMAVGASGNWGAQGANWNYEGAQDFVGGALSTNQGIGGSLNKTGNRTLFKGENAIFRVKQKSLLAKQGDNFIKYGLQNTAYDFAYSKKSDFGKRGWNHLTMFAWGGLSYSAREYSGGDTGNFQFGRTLNYEAINWGVNGLIKKNFKSIKTDGSQANKAAINSFKWFFTLKND